MRPQFTVLRQGESLPFVFSLKDQAKDITGWECAIAVKQFASDAALIERKIKPDTRTHSWPGYLTHTETQALGEGSYRLIGVLTNSSTGEEEQIINDYRFNVTESWAA